MSGCALLGGETAALPDLYNQDQFDLAGFAVGVCELKRMIDVARVEAGFILSGNGTSGTLTITVPSGATRRWRSSRTAWRSLSGQCSNTSMQVTTPYAAV